MQENLQDQSERTKVGFPQANESKKSGNGKVLFLIVIILLILGGTTWYLMSSREETIEFTNDTVTPFATQETPTPIGEEKVDKDALKIQIQNGTGTPGDAGKLEKSLNSLGYTEISTGNASNYNYEAAEVTFGSDFPENYKEELMDALRSMYSSVEEGNASLGDNDAVLITGKAKGSSNATLTPTSRPSVTITPTRSSTITVTPTP
jgi:hypothetical protein